MCDTFKHTTESDMRSLEPSCLVSCPWWIMLACTVNITTASVPLRRDAAFSTQFPERVLTHAGEKCFSHVNSPACNKPYWRNRQKNTPIASAVRYKVGSAPKAHFITFRAKTFSWSRREIAVACWFHVEQIIYRLIRNKMIFHLQANRVRWWVMWCDERLELLF